MDLLPLAFDLAEKYLTIGCVLLDGSIGQMMEPVELPPMREVKRREFPWATTGAKGRHAPCAFLDLPGTGRRGEDQYPPAQALAGRSRKMRFDIRNTTWKMPKWSWSWFRDGRPGGAFRGACRPRAGHQGRFVPAGDGCPFPYARVAELAAQAKTLLVVEMNSGQMLEDVRLAVNGRTPIEFYGRLGGVVPFPG